MSFVIFFGRYFAIFNSRLYYVEEISKNMTESIGSKLCRLCGCDNIDNKYIFDESGELLTKLRTTFSLVVSIFFVKVFYYRFVVFGAVIV